MVLSLRISQERSKNTASATKRIIKRTEHHQLKSRPIYHLCRQILRVFKMVLQDGTSELRNNIDFKNTEKELKLYNVLLLFELAK